MTVQVQATGSTSVVLEAVTTSRQESEDHESSEDSDCESSERGDQDEAGIDYDDHEINEAEPSGYIRGYHESSGLE